MKIRELLVTVFLGICSHPLSGQTGEKSEHLVYAADAAHDGYVVYAPMSSNRTFLIDSLGHIRHVWNSDHRLGRSAYLRDDGVLVRMGITRPRGRFVSADDVGGRIQYLMWDSSVMWDWSLAEEKVMAHHDVEPLPNGNVLMLIWDLKTEEEAIAAGRNPNQVHRDEVWVDGVIEVRPNGESGGEIVWRWSAWDHLVQNLDDSKMNYGEPSEHPDRIDINFIDRDLPDWLHCNSIDYNAELDQIMITCHGFSEFWVIDHSTTKDEAKTSGGGNSGKGGRLLYRFGNPAAYGAEGERTLYRPHDAQWIDQGLPGAGNILVFNNGWGREGEDYSTIEEFKLPDFENTAEASPAPAQTVWTYSSPNPEDFFSQRVSGVQRLANGNTLICAGLPGIFFEVTAENKQVWQFVHPPPPIRTTPRILTADDLVDGKAPRRPYPFPRSATQTTQVSIFKGNWYPTNYPPFEGLLNSSSVPLEFYPTRSREPSRGVPLP